MRIGTTPAPRFISLLLGVAPAFLDIVCSVYDRVFLYSKILDVKSELDHVAWTHDVVAAFGAHLAE